MTQVQDLASGQYAVLLSNMGAGDSVEGREGVTVLLDASGNQLADVRFRPEVGGKLLSHDGALAWHSHDALFHWSGSTVRRYTEIPFEYGLAEYLGSADGRVLASINGWAGDDGYRWALALFDQDGIETWEVPAVLSGVAWHKGHVYAFLHPGLMPEEDRFTRVSPGEDMHSFGPPAQPDTLWGAGLVTDTDHILALHARDQKSAEIWRIEPETEAWDVIPVTGPAADTAPWYVGSAGPSDLTLIDGVLYWIAEDALWSADPSTGASELITELSPDTDWLLKANALIGVTSVDESNGRRVWSIEHLEPTSGAPVRKLDDIRVEGRRDLLVSDVAFLD